MMKVAFVAFAGLFGLATAQTCENVEEYSVRAPTPCRRSTAPAATHQLLGKLTRRTGEVDGLPHGRAPQ
jgi:hypothetical protein